MDMLMIIVESTHRERLESVLVEHAVSGYTEIPTVFGVGSSGLRLGSRAFPETSSILFTIVEEGKAQELVDAIDGACGDCRKAMRMVVWKVDRML